VALGRQKSLSFPPVPDEILEIIWSLDEPPATSNQAPAPFGMIKDGSQTGSFDASTLKRLAAPIYHKLR
jgi:hypothetical protein